MEHIPNVSSGGDSSILQKKWEKIKRSSNYELYRRLQSKFVINANSKFSTSASTNGNGEKVTCKKWNRGDTEKGSNSASTERTRAIPRFNSCDSYNITKEISTSNRYEFICGRQPKNTEFTSGIQLFQNGIFTSFEWASPKRDYLSTLDLKDNYLSIPLHRDSQKFQKEHKIY